MRKNQLSGAIGPYLLPRISGCEDGPHAAGSKGNSSGNPRKSIPAGVRAMARDSEQ